MKCPNEKRPYKTLKKILYDFQKFLHEFYFLWDIILPILTFFRNSNLTGNYFNRKFKFLTRIFKP